jgi:hypothetical protein
VPAIPERKGGQQLILAIPNPNQSRVLISCIRVNNELWYKGQKESWFLRIRKSFIRLKGFVLNTEQF